MAEDPEWLRAADPPDTQPPARASAARRSAAQFLGRGRNPQDSSNDRLVSVHECKGCAFLAAHGVEITYLRTECGYIVPVTFRGGLQSVCVNRGARCGFKATGR
jgi:hypothetical protein